jgi:hypothetical protein
MALKSIGSLWSHKDKEGKPFMSGTIDVKDQEGKDQLIIKDGKISILIFVNRYKKKDTNQPGFKILQAQDSDDSPF